MLLLRYSSLIFFVATVSSNFFNLDEVKNDFFDVGIAGDPVSLQTKEDGSTLIFTPQGHLVESRSSNVVLLSNKNGQPYVCLIPDSTQPSDNATLTSVFISDANITSRLEALQQLSCLRKTVGWWTYELCVGRNIRQFHMDNGVIKGVELTLGHYDGEELWDKNISLTDGEKPIPFSHTQYYTNGTLCELNNKLRRTDVKFICEEGVSAYLHRVDEPSSCQYLFTVKTGFLCDIPGFKPIEARKPVGIECKVALTPAQMETYLESLKDEDFFELMKDEDEDKIISHRRSFMEMIFGPNEDKQLIESMIDDDIFYDELEDDDGNTDESQIRDSRLRDFYRKTKDPNEDPSRETEMVIKLQRLMDKLLKKRAEQLGLDPTKVQTFSMELNPGATEQAAAESKPKLPVPPISDAKKSEEGRKEQLNPLKLIKDLQEGHRDLEWTDEEEREFLSEFDEGLDKLKPELTAAQINRIRSEMSKELDSIVDETEQELKDEGLNEGVTDGAQRAEALKTLTQTLTKLLKRIDDTERSIRHTNEILDEASEKLAKIKATSKPRNSGGEPTKLAFEGGAEGESDVEISETQVKLPSGQLHVQQHASKSSIEDNVGGDNSESGENVNDRVRVRVSKLKSDPTDRATGSISDSLRRKINSQSQVLEDQLAEKLKKAGFDPKGRHVQVKIVTSGYFEDDGNGEFDLLSEAESAQFSNLVVSLLAGDQEVKEQKRMESLEANYNFNVNQQRKPKKRLEDDPQWQKISAFLHGENEDLNEEDEDNLFYNL